MGVSYKTNITLALRLFKGHASESVLFICYRVDFFNKEFLINFDKSLPEVRLSQ